MKRLLLLLLFVFPVSLQAMDQLFYLDLAKKRKRDAVAIDVSKKAPILKLPVEILGSEIIKRCLRSGSIQEKKEKIHQLTLVSRSFYQGLKKAFPTQEEIAWFVCNTPEQYRIKPTVETFNAFHCGLLKFKILRKSMKDYEHWISRCDGMTHLTNVAQIYELNKEQLTLLFRIVILQEGCEPLIPFILCAGADMEEVHHDVAVGLENANSGLYRDHKKNSLHLAIAGGHVQKVEQLLAAGADITRNSLSNSFNDWLFKGTAWAFKIKGYGFSVLDTLISVNIPENNRIKIAKLLFAYGAHMRMDPTSPIEIVKWHQDRGVDAYSNEFLKLLAEKEQETKETEPNKENCVIQ